MAETEQRYNFICPNCSGSFSIQIERIPPVQARFRCPHCKEPMDFPSREEARAYVRLQAETASSASPPAPSDASSPSPPLGVPPRKSDRLPREKSPLADQTGEGQGARFYVEKAGFQTDVFDRRDMRNLIRTGELLETDRIRVDDSAAVNAGDLPYLISLFRMAKEQRAKPPAVCRTHTDLVAFFKCNDTKRPLCEKCAPEKKFGGQTIRVCQHCGGTATDLTLA